MHSSRSAPFFTLKSYKNRVSCSSSLKHSRHPSQVQLACISPCFNLILGENCPPDIFLRRHLQSSDRKFSPAGSCLPLTFCFVLFDVFVQGVTNICSLGNIHRMHLGVWESTGLSFNTLGFASLPRRPVPVKSRRQPCIFAIRFSLIF